jgi:hypothetical protein
MRTRGYQGLLESERGSLCMCFQRGQGGDHSVFQIKGQIFGYVWLSSFQAVRACSVSSWFKTSGLCSCLWFSCAISL